MVDNMKKDNFELKILELVNKFSGQKYALKTDLRNFYRLLYPDLTEQAFRRILYASEKQKLIISVGSGIYYIQNSLSLTHPQKKKFTPLLSQNVKNLNEEIKKTFPYVSYLIWETKILHEFMVHRPGQNTGQP